MMKKSAGNNKEAHKDNPKEDQKDNDASLKGLVDISGENGQEGPIKNVMDYSSTRDLGILKQVSKQFKKIATQEQDSRVPKMEAMEFGDSHTMVIVKFKDNKGLYACGNNRSGQLGLGDSHDRYEWTEVLSRESFLQMLVSAEESDENKKPRPKLGM